MADFHSEVNATNPALGATFVTGFQIPAGATGFISLVTGSWVSPAVFGAGNFFVHWGTATSNAGAGFVPYDGFWIINASGQIAVPYPKRLVVAASLFVCMEIGLSGGTTPNQVELWFHGTVA